MFGDFIMPCFLVCSHLRSAFYWLLAYENPDKFIAVRCESVAQARHGNCYNNTIVPNYLGPKTNFTNKGIYYLPTKEIVPYYLGEDGLKERKYNHNDYLLRVSPDNNVIVWHKNNTIWRLQTNLFKFQSLQNPLDNNYSVWCYLDRSDFVIVLNLYNYRKNTSGISRVKLLSDQDTFVIDLNSTTEATILVDSVQNDTSA